MNRPRRILLKYNELFDFEGAPGAKIEGYPKNEGISVDVYENKGQVEMAPGMSGDLVENRQVIGSLWRSY